MNRLKNIRPIRVTLLIAAIFMVLFAGSMLTTDNSLAAASENIKIMDQNGIDVSFCGFNYDGFVGPEAGLLIENNSDHSYIIQAENVQVNGIAISPIFSCQIASGQKLTDAIIISDWKLDEYGITTIDTIEFNFVVFDSDNWYDDFYSDNICLNI